MKKMLALVAVVIVVSAGASFGVARWVAARRPAAPVVRLQDTAWLQQQLQLTADQARQIDHRAAAFQARLDELCARHCAARVALGDELMKSRVDPDQCRACVEQMNAAQAEAEQATLAHILQVRALLTDAQARRFSALIRTQVCSMPMGAL